MSKLASLMIDSGGGISNSAFDRLHNSIKTGFMGKTASPVAYIPRVWVTSHLTTADIPALTPPTYNRIFAQFPGSGEKERRWGEKGKTGESLFITRHPNFVSSCHTLTAANHKYKVKPSFSGGDNQSPWEPGGSRAGD
ncbi:hypothetical protein CEXT_485611 [Caerostris extrusa]|uniref:Uncharacterized protein n=1 Tax=Caerostris extrusa TaxID=172846 RepID=A0AAV4VY55_CAEEX|nr:hypothetical protein CEXT_485611 [Caerostris extrusa]